MNTGRYKYGRQYEADTGALLVQCLPACEASSESAVQQENVVPNTIDVGIQYKWMLAWTAVQLEHQQFVT